MREGDPNTAYRPPNSTQQKALGLVGSEGFPFEWLVLAYTPTHHTRMLAMAMQEDTITPRQMSSKPSGLMGFALHQALAFGRELGLILRHLGFPGAQPLALGVEVGLIAFGHLHSPVSFPLSCVVFALT